MKTFEKSTARNVLNKLQDAEKNLCAVSLLAEFNGLTHWRYLFQMAADGIREMRCQFEKEHEL